MNATPTTQASDRVHSVILRLGDRFCSLPVDCVREMTVLPEVRKLCGTQSFVPGVITLRGEAIPVVDLRMRLGMEAAVADNQHTIEVLAEREREHLAWIAELEACVKEGREFTLGLDPTKCNFGRWLATFEPPSRELQQLIQGFHAPHRAIHAIAQEVMGLAEAGETKQALECIDRTRSVELTALRSQIERVRNLLSKPPRRIVTVIRIGTEQVGLIVDEVASLAWVRTEDADISREANALDQLFASMGRNEADAQMVSMLEPSALRVHAA